MEQKHSVLASFPLNYITSLSAAYLVTAAQLYNGFGCFPYGEVPGTYLREAVRHVLLHCIRIVHQRVVPEKNPVSRIYKATLVVMMH